MLGFPHKVRPIIKQLPLFGNVMVIRTKNKSSKIHHKTIIIFIYNVCTAKQFRKSGKLIRECSEDNIDRKYKDKSTYIMKYESI